MKPARFAYHAPRSVEEALALLQDVGTPPADRVPGSPDGGRFALAGGQALMPRLARRELKPHTLVDLGRVAGMTGLTHENGVLRVGAMTRLSDLEVDPTVRRLHPCLATACTLSGPVPVRHRATLGGALVHADPSGALPAVALALQAVVEVRGEGVHRVPAEAFILGPHRTALGAGELVVAVEFPDPSARGSVEVVSSRSVGRTLAGAVAVVGEQSVRVVTFGSVPAPAVAVTVGSGSATQVADAVLDGLALDDGDGLSAASRRTLLHGVVARAVESARAGAPVPQIAGPALR